MAAVWPPYNVHCSSLRPRCALYLLICVPLGFASMLWSNVFGGRTCIPSVFLRYVVIGIASALLATGWLLVSVLSVISEIIPTLLNVPPTLPRMHARQDSRDEVVSTARPQPQESVSMTTGVEWSYERKYGGAIITSRTVIENTQTIKPIDSHRVRFAPEDESGPVASTSHISPPRTPERVPTDDSLESLSTLPRVPTLPLAQPGILSNDPGAVPRGRKLSFIRRRFAEKHGRSKSSSFNKPLTPPGSAATSPGRSPERVEVSLQRASTTPQKGKGKQRLCDMASPRQVPVRRTDPYQAPYFFPTPLSPEADGYASKVRSERAGRSPEYPLRMLPPMDPPAMLPTPEASPEPRPHIDLTPDPLLSPSTTPEPPATAPPGLTAQSKTKRRSWHFPLPHPTHQSLERPNSWTSDAPTANSSSGESSHRDGSSPKRRISGIWRHGGNGQLAPLSPLQSTVAIDEVSMTRPTQKRSWHIFHRRSVSDHLPLSRASSPPAISNAEQQSMPRPKRRRD